jgi:hypothetical protein
LGKEAREDIGKEQPKEEGREEGGEEDAIDLRVEAVQGGEG